MSLKDKWKKFGKDAGNTAKDVGKALGTSAKVFVGNTENKNEDGTSKLKETWTKVGHDFESTGKSLGKATISTTEKVVNELESEEKTQD